MDNDKRENVRIDEHLTVSYHLLKMPHRVSSRIADISEGGVRLPVMHQFTLGTILEIEICSSELPKSIEAIGRVVWSKARKDMRFPFEVGIKFTKIDPSDYNQLRQYIRRVYKAKEAKDVGWIEGEEVL